jgi:glycosyltransferase involved in cell wall biosynthesis
MKVLHVISSLDPRFGGPSTVLPIMANALVAEGLQVDVLCADAPAAHASADACCLQPGGWRLWRVGGWGSRWRLSLPVLRWLWRRVHEYDVVHVHGLLGWVPMLAMKFSCLRSRPWVVRPMGTLGGFSLKQGRVGLKRLWLRWIDLPLLRRASAIHCTSRMEQREVEALGLERAVRIALGLPKAAWPEPAEQAERAAGAAAPKVLYLSRLDAKKGIETLLEAWSVVGPSKPAAQLWIAGGGPAEYVADLQGKSSSLGLEDSVCWLGAVHGSDRLRLWSEASAFVLPSYHENFGVALLEAMQQGLPCVSTLEVALATEPECRDALIRVKAGDAGELAAALRLLLDDPELASQLGRRAAAAAAHFCPSTMAGELHRLYCSISAQS